MGLFPFLITRCDPDDAHEPKPKPSPPSLPPLLQPENILLKNPSSGEIKLIDFGSACFENRTVYSYIQSR